MDLGIVTLLLACTEVGVTGDPRSDPAPVAAGGESVPGTDDTGDIPEPDDTERLYVEGVIHEIGLTVSRDSERSLQRDGTQYVPATLTFGEESWEVGIHIKGSSTWTSFDEKPSLKVDAEFVGEGMEVLGHSKFNLHNQYIDPMMMSESLTFGFWRDAGLPAARTAYAHLTVNDEDYGLYGVVEPTTREFLGRWFDETDGNLYENSYQDCDFDVVDCFEKEQDDEGNDDALHELADAVMLTGNDWERELPAQFDWERFVDFLALEILLAHWDSYSFDRSNYRLYHQPLADDWTFIPWSADLGFGYRPWSAPECHQYAVDPDTYVEGVLAARCHASEMCIEAVKAQAMVRADWFETLGAHERLDDTRDLVRASVYADDRKYWGNDDFDRHSACVEEFFLTRPEEVREWARSR